MKIAIQTIVDYNNYGNRLQNYALQEILEEMGHDVVTIRNDYQGSKTKKNLIQRLHILINFRKFAEKSKNKLELFFRKSLDSRREENFLIFTKKNIKESSFKYEKVPTNDKDLKEIDLLIIGSDQVWNFNFYRFSSMDFLTYTSKPKISYAASFGVSEIPENLKKQYIDGLNTIDYISVRESAGKDIVKELTGKDATVVLDPTLMLTKKDWEKLIKDNPKYNERFILTYFLDKPEEKNLAYIKDYAKQRDYKIKNLADINDKELWIADPSEFVNLFSQAEAIFTDSFHACVFSIIFEKYFEVFERNTELPSMNSRIDTLFSDLNLEDRWHSKRMNEAINYEIVKSKLAVRKQESLTFLASSIDNVKKDLKK